MAGGLATASGVRSQLGGTEHGFGGQRELFELNFQKIQPNEAGLFTRPEQFTSKLVIDDFGHINGVPLGEAIECPVDESGNLIAPNWSGQVAQGSGIQQNVEAHG